MEIDDEHAEVEIIDYNAQCGNNVSSPHLICVFIFWSCDPKMLAHAMPPLFFFLSTTYISNSIQLWT